MMTFFLLKVVVLICSRDIKTYIHIDNEFSRYTQQTVAAAVFFREEKQKKNNNNWLN